MYLRQDLFRLLISTEISVKVYMSNLDAFEYIGKAVYNLPKPVETEQGKIGQKNSKNSSI